MVYIYIHIYIHVYINTYKKYIQKIYIHKYLKIINIYNDIARKYGNVTVKTRVSWCASEIPYF